ncbi:hypothetical protein DE146DRAFT_604195 [Phaeosphaeria sp. MPI-PUGE-AT-0046c]|nr:hypothetical protein DE146DRAFT_604195 [Phaeosphaeria sp. MPI-PUGE-AT-0046c]
MDEYEEAILFTFSAFESRLDRLEYVLSGRTPTEEKPRTIPDRIHNIERALQALGAQTSLLQDTQDLLSKHKDVLVPKDDRSTDSPLDTSQKAALVVERATGFATVVSQLKALHDQQIPDIDGFTKLAKLRPRIAEAEERHMQQALKISELRRRNDLVNEYYKQIHIIGAGRVWIDYSLRVRKGLKVIKREEFKRRSEEEEQPKDVVQVEHKSEDEDDEDEEL